MQGLTFPLLVMLFLSFCAAMASSIAVRRVYKQDMEREAAKAKAASETEHKAQQTTNAEEAK